MTSIRHFALSCCLLCALAGVIRLFWPENRFKPVINTALLLYIVASAVPLARGADWPALGREVRGWAAAEAPAADYSAYAASLGQASAAAAVQAALLAVGIRAEVTVTEDLCKVTLPAGADATLAEQIAREACGTLPCVVEGGVRP